jgi:hypothetical protein
MEDVAQGAPAFDHFHAPHENCRMPDKRGQRRRPCCEEYTGEQSERQLG